MTERHPAQREASPSQTIEVKGPPAMNELQRRADETMEGFVIRAIRSEERDACAKIAEDMGHELGEPAIGGAIAATIRHRS